MIVAKGCAAAHAHDQLYSNRFYNRQFITRKIANDEILIRLDRKGKRTVNDHQFVRQGNSLSVGLRIPAVV